jgi:TPR repeat protein
MIAQAGLGLMLLNGWGVNSNPKTALKLFTMAADQGSPDGQFHIGQMVGYFLLSKKLTQFTDVSRNRR